MKVISGSSFGFNGPDGVSSDGAHVWANSNGQSVTELPASKGPRYSAGRGARTSRAAAVVEPGRGRCRAVAVTEQVST